MDDMDGIKGVGSQYIRFIDSIYALQIASMPYRQLVRLIEGIVRLINLCVSSYKMIYGPLNESLCNIPRLLPFRLPYISIYKFQTFGLPVLDPNKEYLVWKIIYNSWSNSKSLILVPNLTRKKRHLPKKIILRVMNQVL